MSIERKRPRFAGGLGQFPACSGVVRFATLNELLFVNGFRRCFGSRFGLSRCLSFAIYEEEVGLQRGVLSNRFFWVSQPTRDQGEQAGLARGRLFNLAPLCDNDLESPTQRRGRPFSRHTQSVTIAATEDL